MPPAPLPRMPAAPRGLRGAPRWAVGYGCGTGKPVPMGRALCWKSGRGDWLDDGDEDGEGGWWYGLTLALEYRGCEEGPWP